jgi:nucleotide-binding universal stress UspA family protein
MVRQRQQEQNRVAARALRPSRHLRARQRPHTSPNVRQAEERGGERHSPPIRRILVPLDGSVAAEAVLPFVETLARRLKASLILFQAIRPTAVTSAIPETSPYLPDVVGFLRADAERYLERIADDLATAGLEVSTMVTVESPESGIVSAANDLKADLVALATHGRSGVARWVKGSTADAVVRRTGLPCLVVRASDEVR